MDGLFKVAGIFNPAGQQYTPVDAESLMPYREASNGQILQEGICEAGAMASFQAAGSAYAVHGVPTIPFYIFYSMFGFQRVGDMIWSCADMMCKGFLLGGTAGRTTLNGEGLQHQDGQSHTLASTFPNIKSYDPAFSYELAVIVEDGIDRMYRQDEKIFYYITLYNQNYTMPARGTQEGLSEQIIQGGYCFRRSDADGPIVNLLSSGAILQEALKAADQLGSLGMAVNVWSITSFTELTRNGVNVDRSNRLNNETHKSYVEKLFENEQGVFVAATDYLKSLALGIEKWMPGHYEVLGTDGFGLSESRPDVRKHFEVDAGSIVQAALYGLVAEEKMSSVEYKKAIKTLDSVAEK
jgi:pyruvate dehydrogenase E1 component